jgi:3-hydroxybutyryl-CoA dehydrogenase
MTIRTVAVLGAGLMGRGIAQVAALGGFRTRLQDTSAEALAKAIAHIEGSLERERGAGRLSADAATTGRAALSTVATLEEAADGADLVIEAVPERIDLKLQVFAALDRAAPAHALLASNTSSMSVTEMAAVTSRPRQVVGMHFFNPVPRMKLLEVVRALESSDEAVAAACAAGEAMGKECVVVRESPGFVTTRINALIGNEAFFMLEAGVASARDIDRALKLGLNHPMGPFELMDLVGLDTRMSILRHLHRTLGEKYRPCPLMEQYVAAGRLGRKVGRGVHDYPEA